MNCRISFSVVSPLEKRSFATNDFGEIEFVLDGLIYPNRTSNFLYEFVRSSSDGGFENYKKSYDLEQKKKEDAEVYQKKEFNRIYDLRKTTFELRKNIRSEKNQTSYILTSEILHTTHSTSPKSKCRSWESFVTNCPKAVTP